MTGSSVGGDRASRTFGRVAAIAALALASVLPAVASGALGAAPATHLMGMKGASGIHAATSSSNLVDHGGKVLPASDTYAIWWGSSSAWSSDVQPGMDSFFNGLNGSTLLGIGQQYMRGSVISSSFKGDKFDPSSPPNKVSASTLGAEVQRMFGTSLDPNGVYFVFTSNFPRGGNFCAWHSYASVAGQNVSVAYMPNTTNVAGCNPGNSFNLSKSEGLLSLSNVTSHEFMEAITDAIPGSSTYGWIDSSGSEIGDKCAWQFGSNATTLSNGSTWQLQMEWSNAVTGCVSG